MFIVVHFSDGEAYCTTVKKLGLFHVAQISGRLRIGDKKVCIRGYVTQLKNPYQYICRNLSTKG